MTDRMPEQECISETATADDHLVAESIVAAGRPGGCTAVRAFPRKSGSDRFIRALGLDASQDAWLWAEAKRHNVGMLDIVRGIIIDCIAEERAGR